MKRPIRFFIVLIVIGVGVYTAAYMSTINEVTITVTDKERIVENHSSSGVDSKYLVFTEDEVYENTDNMIFGKFKSSKLQGSLKVDSTYNVKVVGWRIGIFSSYKNIIKIVE